MKRVVLANAAILITAVALASCGHSSVANPRTTSTPEASAPRFAYSTSKAVLVNSKNGSSTIVSDAAGVDLHWDTAGNRLAWMSVQSDGNFRLAFWEASRGTTLVGPILPDYGGLAWLGERVFVQGLDRGLQECDASSCAPRRIGGLAADSSWTILGATQSALVLATTGDDAYGGPSQLLSWTGPGSATTRVADLDDLKGKSYNLPAAKGVGDDRGNLYFVAGTRGGACDESQQVFEVSGGEVRALPPLPNGQQFALSDVAALTEADGQVTATMVRVAAPCGTAQHAVLASYDLTTSGSWQPIAVPGKRVSPDIAGIRYALESNVALADQVPDTYAPAGLSAVSATKAEPVANDVTELAFP